MFHTVDSIRENAPRRPQCALMVVGGWMDAQALVWFGIGGGAAIFACSLLFQRYVKKTAVAVQSRGAFTMFALLMFIFALGAVAAGFVAAAAA